MSEKREVIEALHFLFHCALKDKKYTTQKEQFDVVFDYIKKQQEKIEELEAYIDGYNQGRDYDE